jgi:two-component system, OmpR family, copper resistance phosphate regulon response regulator CusR
MFCKNMKQEFLKRSLTMKPILIVEDELRTAQNIQKGLSQHGYLAEIANNGEYAITLLTKCEFELVVLDVMLPIKDGWVVLEWIKAHEKLLPVIMLTAQSDLPNKLKGLNLGADDYLGKPFSFSELLARIEAIFRRTKFIIPTETIKIADLKINLLTQTVTRQTKKLELAPKEFQLLCTLAENAGRFISREKLAERVWDMAFDCETNVVDVAIRRLRQKVDIPFDHSLIHTVRGVGYVLENRKNL